MFDIRHNIHENTNPWIQNGCETIGTRIQFAILGGGNATVGSDIGDLVGNDDLGVMIPELWSSAIFRYFEKALTFRPFFDDYSSLVRGKGDAINIPEIQEVTVGAKAANTNVSYTTNVETSLQLQIDKHKYAAKLFEDIALIQANEPLVSKYAQSMGYALAKQVDTDIETALQSMATGISLGADNTLSNAKAEEAYATILELDIDPAECAWFVNPTLYADIVSNAGWTQGAASSLVVQGFTGGAQSGQSGTLYGMPVFMTPLITSATGATNEVGYLCHKSCVAVAVQQDIRVQSDYSIDNLGTRVVADVIYGVKLTDHANHKKGVRLNQPS